ncbi:MAG: LacI family DNA-binding transcriptional regulator [Paracoccaceae bacterium]
MIGYSQDITNKSPTHRFPIKEVARQSGLSTATIARARNDRGNVSPKPRHGLPPLFPSLKEKKCN